MVTLTPEEFVDQELKVFYQEPEKTLKDGKKLFEKYWGPVLSAIEKKAGRPLKSVGYIWSEGTEEMEGVLVSVISTLIETTPYKEFNHYDGWYRLHILEDIEDTFVVEESYQGVYTLYFFNF